MSKENKMIDDVANLIAGTKPANKSGRYVPVGAHVTILDEVKTIQIRKKGSQDKFESAVVFEFRILESDNEDVTIGETYGHMYCLERNDYAVKNMHRDVKLMAGTTEDFTVDDMKRVLGEDQILCGQTIKIFGTERIGKESGTAYTVLDFKLVGKEKDEGEDSEQGE